MFDLKQEFGAGYFVRLDESVKIPGQSREDRLWLYQIPAKYGHIYPHSETHLGGYTDRRGIMTRLANLPGVRVHQHGDTELTVVFTPEHFPAVADLLRARKRPRRSAEQKAAATRRLAEFRSRGQDAELAKPEASARAPDASPESSR
jgi:hypothetical protein